MNGLALPFSNSFSLIYNKNVRYPTADTAVGQDVLLREKANKQANNLFVIPTTDLDHTAPSLFTQSIRNNLCVHGFVRCPLQFLTTSGWEGDIQFHLGMAVCLGGATKKRAQNIFESENIKSECMLNIKIQRGPHCPAFRKLPIFRSARLMLSTWSLSI